jgi:hypothetical protein
MQVEVKTVGAGALEPPPLISLCSFSPEIIGTGFDEKEPLHGGQVKNQDRAKTRVFEPSCGEVASPRKAGHRHASSGGG